MREVASRPPTLSSVVGRLVEVVARARGFSRLQALDVVSLAAMSFDAMKIGLKLTSDEEEAADIECGMLLRTPLNLKNKKRNSDFTEKRQ